MIRHIFRKDWKLLWPLVPGIAAVQVLNTALWFALWNFGGSQMLSQMSELCSAAMFLVMGAMVAIAVQQDAVPGDRQDWLVRPICRRDLILAKLLFILVVVHGPMFVMDLTLGQAMGFPFGTMLRAAVSHGLSILVNLSLPVFAMAAMTPNLVVLFGGALTIGLVEIVVIFLMGSWNQSHAGLWPLSSVWWIIPAFWTGLALLVVIVTVPLQYFRRATAYARGIAIGAVCLAPMAMLLPWAPAFSLQQKLSADPAAARDIGIVFDPAVGRQVAEPGGRNHANSVWLPLRVSGLVANSIVINDRTTVRIVNRAGQIVYQGQATGPIHALSDIMDNFPVRTAAGGEVRTHQLVTLPGHVYELVRKQPVRMDLGYSLTLFRIGGADRIPALGGDKRMATIGRCKTGIDSDGDEVELLCIDPGNDRSCGSAVLENAISGKRNPPRDFCVPDYNPYPRPFMRFSMYPFALDLNFRDPQGLAKYPVDSAQLADAQVALETFKPVAHFTRHLVIPNIRPEDWEAQTSAVAAAARPAR